MVIAPLLHGDARVSRQTSVRDRARTALRSLWAEVRGAGRLAARQPLFTSLLVVVLTLAIGASVAMFSVLNAVALRPLPYGSPQQLMALWSIRPDGSRGPFTIQDYVDLRERDIGSESVGAFAAWSANLTGVGTAERLQGMRTSANAFGVLRVAAIAGRTFLASDDAGGRVVVLGHGLWTRRFGADPAVVGRVLTLNSANYTVVGVLPRGFVFPIRDAELAVPIVEAEARRVEGDVGFLRLVARLRPDVSRAQAELLMTAATRELQRLRPETNARKVAIRLVPLHEQIVGDYAITLRLLLGAVLLVLVLACVNLASLSLARTCARQRELAIRAALGVGRFRLAAQLLMETLLPAAVAGAAGLVLAAWQTRLLLALAPAAMPRANDVSLDLPVVLFGIGATLATGVAVGLWPAIRMSRIDPADDLRGLGRAAGASQSLTIRRGLVAAEVAISLVLAVSTALFVQSLRRVQEVAPGFASERVLSMRLSLSRERYKDRSEVLAFQERLQTRLRALPGVEAVGGTSLIPLSGMQASVDFVVDGQPVRPDQMSEAEYRVVSPDYFDTVGIRLLNGRPFTERDRAGSIDVAIVNKTLADRLWPGRDPVGKRLRIEPGARIDQVVNIVGVVADVKHFGLDGAPTMDLYVPFAQLPEPSVVWITNNQFWVMRTAGNPLAVAAAARAALAEADPDVPAASVRTLEQAIDATLAARRFNAWIVALFGYAALALTACGIYAVSAHAVAARSRELGIRAALGASPRGLVALVLRTDFAAVVLGLAGGLLVARAVASALGGLLFDVRPGDPGPYAAVTILLALVGATACYVPASRAARSNPLRAIRND
jgi:predicted permease